MANCYCSFIVDIKGDLWSEVVNNVPHRLHYKLFCENVKTREKEKPLRLQPFMGNIRIAFLSRFTAFF
jgi:hypothetical protein